MTEEAQIRALAKLDGWREEYIHGNGMDCDVWTDGREVRGQPLDYLNDLNALHKIEETLTDDELIRWERILCEIVSPQSLFRGTDGYAHVMAQVHRASARQRAEALVRVKGLWHD
jgi:hypothetical protein